MSAPPHLVTPVEALLARVADALDRVEARLACPPTDAQAQDVIERLSSQLRAAREECQRLRQGVK